MVGCFFSRLDCVYGVQSNMLMLCLKRREYFCTQRKLKWRLFFSTIHLHSVSPRQRSAILDITHRTQAAYALLYPPQHKDASSTCIYALIWMKMAQPCIEAYSNMNRFLCALLVFSSSSLKQHNMASPPLLHVPGDGVCLDSLRHESGKLLVVPMSRFSFH